MGDSGLYRKVDILGRIVIPKEIRMALDIQDNEPVSFSADPETRTIVLKCQKPKCLRCGSTADLRLIKTGFYLCRSCIGAL